MGSAAIRDFLLRFRLVRDSRRRTDLEDELCHFSPLQETISPLPESGDDVPMSPSRYPAPPVPTMDISVPETRVSPSRSRMVNTLPTIDVCAGHFTSYSDIASGFGLFSPGSSASMDRFLASDSILMDVPSDLPLLQLPLLPMPDAGVSPPGPVAGPPQPNLSIEYTCVA